VPENANGLILEEPALRAETIEKTGLVKQNQNVIADTTSYTGT